MLLLGVIAAGSFVSAGPATGRVVGPTYDEPFAYCAAVGTINRPDARYTGPETPEEVKEPFGYAAGAYRWRCVDGDVWSCSYGANLPCGKANTRRTPTFRMKRYCRNHPNGPIPAAVTGHATIYLWNCNRGQARRGRQAWHVDAQGFVRELWRQATPLPTTACSDGIDNDEDGKIDFPSDPGCSTASDTSEEDAPAAQCSDGTDNDGDGAIDFPSDSGCSSATDSAETTSAYQCDDGLDNDSDGLIDYPDDQECSSSTDATEAEASNCDPSYPTLCLDPSASDYDCAGGGGDGPYYVYETNFPVLPPDPFGLDGDDDGIGCEA